MCRYFVEKDPFGTEELFLKMFRDEYYSRNIVKTSLISAIEIACWNIKGKPLDQPVYDLLGGDVQDGSIRTYANAWYRIRTECPTDSQAPRNARSNAASTP